MKNKVIFSLTVIIALACTVAIYCLAFEEYKELFFINVSVACLTEVLILLNVPLLSSGRILTFNNASTSFVVTSYAFLLFLWTSGVSIFMTDDSSFKPLLIGVLVLTLAFAIALGAIEYGTGSAKKQGEAVASGVHRRRFSATHLASLLDEIKELAENVQDEHFDDRVRLLGICVDKITTIPVAKLERRKDILEESYNKLNEIKQLLEHGYTEPVIVKIDDFKTYATLIKNSI